MITLPQKKTKPDLMLMHKGSEAARKIAYSLIRASDQAPLKFWSRSRFSPDFLLNTERNILFANVFRPYEHNFKPQGIQIIRIANSIYQNRLPQNHWVS